MTTEQLNIAFEQIWNAVLSLCEQDAKYVEVPDRPEITSDDINLEIALQFN